MLSVALLSLLVPAVGTMNVTSSSALLQQGDPPVEIWVNKTDARLGDRVKVHARTYMDGYVLILHAEPDGRIRVLFPIDPVYDNFVRGGERFEVIGRGDREAFRVYSASGTGTVYAAYSRDPFRFDGFARNNHWDYGLPDTWWVLDDAEADLTNLASQMAGGAYFDYDLLEYSVWDATVASSGSATQITYYGSTPYYSPWSFGVGFYWGWGPSYYPYSYYWDRWYWRTRYYYGWYPYSWYHDWYYGGYYDWYRPYRYYYSYYPPRYYGGYTTPVVYGDTHLRYRPRLTASNSDSRARRAYVPTTGAGRVAAASSASATARGVTGSGRRTMPQVSGRAATTERSTASTERGVSTARRTTGVSRQPAQSSSSSRATTARRTTSRTQVAPSRTPTSGSQVSPSRTQTSRPQASPTRTQTSRSTPTVRRTPTAGSQPSQPTRSSARAAPAPRTSVRQPVQRSEPSVSNRTAVRTNPAPSRSTPVRATPSAPARTPAARPAPAPRVSSPSAPSASRPSAPSRPSSSSSKPSSSSSSSSRPRKP